MLKSDPSKSPISFATMKIHHSIIDCIQDSFLLEAQQVLSVKGAHTEVWKHSQYSVRRKTKDYSWLIMFFFRDFPPMTVGKF